MKRGELLKIIRTIKDYEHQAILAAKRAEKDTISMYCSGAMAYAYKTCYELLFNALNQPVQ
jgi:hypothetical protein